MKHTPSFSALTDELCLWQDTGLKCRFWWRDDDLIDISPKLHRMRQISERYIVYVLVAVIPRDMQFNLGYETSGMHTFVWCQHGYAHQNHEISGQANSEFPLTRNRQLIVDDLSNGHRLLSDQFGERLLPVLVPPWNSFREDMVSNLPELGYVGLSQYGPISDRTNEAVCRANTHLDIVDWSTAPKFPSNRTAFLLNRIVEELSARRVTNPQSEEAFGVLTHHRAMDDEAWDFIETLLSVTHEFPCVEWISPRDLFRP